MVSNDYNCFASLLIRSIRHSEKNKEGNLLFYDYIIVGSASPVVPAHSRCNQQGE